MLSYFSNPARFEAFARWASPISLFVLLACLAVAVPMGLYFSPEDYQQGHTVRIMYVHVPAAIMSELAFGFIAVMSLTAFVWRHSLADSCARAAAGPGAIFAGLTLLTGSIWGHPTWGTWWVWDARLTSMLILFLTYIGYIAVWQMGTDETKSARLARIVGMVGFINVPIVKFSVDWWNSLHQDASILRADGPTIHASMLWPLGLMALAYMALFAWLVLSGVRTSIYEKQIARRSERTASRPIATDGTAEGA
ncbi:MAG: heme ABC transporter permease CcmC [Hyphomonadaceae bacterium]